MPRATLLCRVACLYLSQIEVYRDTRESILSNTPSTAGQQHSAFRCGDEGRALRTCLTACLEGGGRRGCLVAPVCQWYLSGSLRTGMQLPRELWVQTTGC